MLHGDRDIDPPCAVIGDAPVFHALVGGGADRAEAESAIEATARQQVDEAGIRPLDLQCAQRFRARLCAGRQVVGKEADHAGSIAGMQPGAGAVVLHAGQIAGQQSRPGAEVPGAQPITGPVARLCGADAGAGQHCREADCVQSMSHLCLLQGW